MKWQIRQRSTLILITIIIILFSATGIHIFFSSVREALFHRFVTDMSQPLSQTIISLVKQEMLINQSCKITNSFKLIENESSIRDIYLLNKDLKIITATDSSKVGKILESKLRTFSKDFPETSITTHSTDGSDLIIASKIENTDQCAQCHDKSDKDLGYVMLVFNDTLERKLDKSLIWIDFTSTGSIFLLFFLIILIIHRRYFQQPYNRIQEGIINIENGDLKTIIEIDQTCEMKKLAGSINKMTTNLDQNQQELAQLHKEEIDKIGQLALVGELAASVAHEIKNPVSGIRNAIDIILEENESMQNQDIFIEIKNQTERVFKTMNDLLLFAKPKKIRFNPVSIHELLDESLKMFESQGRKKGIQIHRDYDSLVNQIDGHAETLKSAFLNLLLNAYHACPEQQGHIHIHTTYDTNNKSIKIYFDNNGPLIPEINLSRIFKPFYTTKAKGTGLGLSITYSVIQKHQGNIYAENINNSGVRFIIIIPITHHSKNEKAKI